MAKPGVTALVLIPLLLIGTMTCLAAMTPSSACSSFAFRLFKNETQGKTGNVLLSPFGAYIVLRMVLEAADGKTYNQMAQVLKVSPNSVPAKKIIDQMVCANESAQLNIASAVYADQNTPFNKKYLDTCIHQYDAEAYNKDFSDPYTLKTINNWCAEKTKGKISEIIEKLSAQDKMVLINALYFKGSWSHPFETAETLDDQFTSAPGQQVPIKMMHQQSRFMYSRHTNFCSVAIPYSGGKQCMYIFLPDKNVDMSLFQAQFTQSNWDKWMQSYQMSKVDLSLPRFRVEYSTELNDSLKAIGMAEAFTPAANFSKMISPAYRIWISQILQKTYMNVDENGTEAAAVTAAIMRTTAVFSPKLPIEFRVDRPFVIALVDNPTGEILFLGTIQKP